MARLVTLASLKEQARQRADQVNSGFVSDSELELLINTSLTELYDLLVGAYGEDYFVGDPYAITSTGVSKYDLPDDFYKLVGVDFKVDSVNWRTMKPFMFAERNRGYLSGNSSGDTYKYRLRGSQIEIRPTPPTGRQFQIHYAPACPVLDDDTDEFDFINGWEEFVILGAAIDMMNKEESDSSALVAKKNTVAARLSAMKKDRDIGMPMRITDVRGTMFRDPLDEDFYD